MRVLFLTIIESHSIKSKVTENMHRSIGFNKILITGHYNYLTCQEVSKSVASATSLDMAAIIKCHAINIIWSLLDALNSPEQLFLASGLLAQDELLAAELHLSRGIYI